MVQGINKEYIFYKEEYIKKYLEIIKRKRKDYNFEILAYCVMNNHAHFLIYVEDISELGSFMHKVNLIYAQMYNSSENRCGVLFRNRYKSEAISEIKYLINCIKYIHDNPVRANMVQNCADYKYSSYNDYITNTGCTQSKIMNQLFGKKFDYSKAFKSCEDKRFMDIEEEKEKCLKDFIERGIYNFEKINKESMIGIMSYRERFKELVDYLYNECRF